MRLVFATHNANKVKEMAYALPAQFEVLSLKDINCFEDIDETESTLEGNAQLKADYVFNKYGYPTFADDTGLLVDALNGEPGVYSARYAGEEANAENNMQKLLTNLEGVANRSAHFKTVIAFKSKEGTKLFSGTCHGTILEEKNGDKGFGYDPIFRPDGYTASFAQMDLEEKNNISHRGKATKALVAFLKTLV